MSDQNPSENWELQEGGDEDDRWVLEESEQNLTDQWQLEKEPEEPVSEWQPVEYEKPRRGGPAWILPTFVTVALLGVLAYSGYTLFPRLVEAIAGRTSATATATLEGTPSEGIAAASPVITQTVTAAVPTDPPTPTVEPTATLMPPPTPPMVNQEFGTVTSTYGVNARRSPDTEAEIIRILALDENFFVFDVVTDAQGDRWLMLYVADDPVVEGQPIPRGVIGYAAAEFFADAVRAVTAELVKEIMEIAGITPTPPPVPTEAAAVEPPAEVDITEQPTAADIELPTVTPASETGEDTSTQAPTTPAVSEPVSVTITIDAINGLNVRTQPDLISEVVALLPDQTTVQAISRYANNDWIQVQLADGAQGWAFREFVIVNGDLNSLSTTTLGELPPTPSPTPTPTETPVVETGPVVPPEPYTDQLPAGTPGVTVPSAAGVNAREAPSTESAVTTILPQNAALPAAGKSADAQWVLVELPQGGRAWVFSATVVVRGGIDSLPVVDEGSESAPAQATVSPEDQPEASVAATPTSQTEAEAAPTPTGAIVTMRLIVVPVYPDPSTAGESIERIGRGTVLQAVGRTEAGDWIQVQTSSGATGWVAATSVDPGDGVDALPVVE